MDKATPTPASVDSVMALFVTAANARASWMETGFNRADAEQAEASLRAEVERLAAQATTAQAVRMLTAEEIKALTAMVWGAPCSGHDLAVFTSAVKAMEALRPGERPMDPADGGRLLEVDACGDPMPSGRTIPPSGVIGGAA